jgi:hypothetical protein
MYIICNATLGIRIVIPPHLGASRKLGSPPPPPLPATHPAQALGRPCWTKKRWRRLRLSLRPSPYGTRRRSGTTGSGGSRRCHPVMVVNAHRDVSGITITIPHSILLSAILLTTPISNTPYCYHLYSPTPGSSRGGQGAWRRSASDKPIGTCPREPSSQYQRT